MSNVMNLIVLALSDFMDQLPPTIFLQLPPILATSSGGRAI